VVVRLGDEPIISVDDYHSRLRDYGAGDTVDLEIWTQGHPRHVTLKALAFPMDRAPDLALRLIGIEVDDIAPQRQRFQSGVVVAEDGVVVTKIKKDGHLARSGVKPGDVIRQLGDLKVSRTADFYRAVVKYRNQDSVVILLQRANQRYYITLALTP
jgi:S1-C subfamily serine protease